MAREKQKRRQYTAEFKRQALERMKVSDNIVRLAEELGVSRPILYQWEAVAEGRGRGTKRKAKRAATAPGERESELQNEVKWLEQALARKMKEADFFKGALQKVEARRRSSGSNGGTESTTRSGK